ncbi:MAG: DUF881 domain-containing protein [Armatimonadota bacterium]
MKDKSKFSWDTSLIVCCIILGVLISLQFKTQKKEGFPLNLRKTEELVKIINNLERERNKLKADLTLTRKQMEDYEKSASQGMSTLELLQNQISQIRLEAGYVPVQGPGIVVILNDSPGAPKPGEDPYFFLVHDTDLQVLVSELWGSNAEAISINDQRIVYNTAIRCVGPTICINSKRLQAPYVVAAIGPTNDMEVALKMPGGFIDSRALSIKNGVRIKIFTKDNITVPAYTGSFSFRYAKPVEE